MDSLFGIGLPELIAILLIAGIVMGPERIVQAARWLGKVSAKAQGVLQGFVTQLNSELDTVDSGGELRAMIGDMQQQIDGLKRDISQPVTGNNISRVTPVAQPDDDLNRTIAPPRTQSAPVNGLTEFKPGKEPPGKQPYKLTSFPKAGTNSAAATVRPSTPPSMPLPSRVHVGDDPDE